MRAAVYTRQSLDKKGDGLAVARQLAACEKLAADRGWDIVARLSDNDASAYDERKKRPGYERLTAMMERRACDIIVAWAVDRFTRRLADLVTLIDLAERTGVKVATVSGDLDLSTDQGRLVARILGSVAQGEVERKSARQKLAARQAAEAGIARKATPRPFGWQADRVSADPVEGPAVAGAARALLAGGTISGICRDWQARGLKPVQSKSGTWTRSSVTQILRNPRVAGIATYRGTEVGRGEWEALVPEETWRAVLRVLNAPGRKPSMGVRTMLGGLALCHCENKVTGSLNQLGQKIYRCNPQTRDGRPGPHATIRCDPIDHVIGELVIGRMSMDDAVDLITPRPDIDAQGLHDEAVAIRSRLRALGPMFMQGQIDEQDLVSGRRWGEERLAEIATMLADAGQESVLAPFLAGANARAVWDGLGTDRRRAVVDALMTVTLSPAGQGTREIDPEKVIHIAWKQG